MTSRTDWPLPNADLASTRSRPRSPIDVQSVATLRPVWRFAFRAAPGFSGIFASTPVTTRGVVYLQDLSSNVFALRLRDGKLLWSRRYGRPTGGPNGLATGGGRLFGNTDRSAFALDLRTGAELWRRRLTGPREQSVDVAPVVVGSTVYTGTVGRVPAGKGAIYALDSSTGRVRWKLVTIRDEWAVPQSAGGGGIWYPLSADGDGVLYAGNSNAYPWGGSRRFPNGAAYRGRALYTDSLLALDPDTGRIRWYDQVTPHDVRDYDFQLSPIVLRVRRNGASHGIVVGGGKGGRVVAWSRRTHRRLWIASVGLHQHDRGPLPRRLVRVCPGLLGGVLTPMAAAAGRVFVPVVDLCMPGSAYGYRGFYSVDYGRGLGELVTLGAATGRRLWRHRFTSPLFGCATAARGVVLTATYDGRIWALDARNGAVLWRSRARAGINACLSLAGDTLLVGAGVDFTRRGSTPELVAYRLTNARR